MSGTGSARRKPGGLMEMQKGIPVNNRQADEIIETINNCFLCGHTLQFVHVTDFKTLQVSEDARCTACGIKQKTSHFKLQ
jgi:hypothetical protein